MVGFRDAYIVESSGGRRIGVVRRDGDVWRYYRLLEERTSAVFETRADAARALEMQDAEQRNR